MREVYRVYGLIGFRVRGMGFKFKVPEGWGFRM